MVEIDLFTELKKKFPLKFDRLLKTGQSFCLSCGYEPQELEGLHRGFGCPECESAFVITISEDHVKVELDLLH